MAYTLGHCAVLPYISVIQHKEVSLRFKRERGAVLWEFHKDRIVRQGPDGIFRLHVRPALEAKQC